QKNGSDVENYVPGETYDVSVTVSHPQFNKFGFQLTALNTAGNSNVGVISVGSGLSVREDQGRNRIYVNHQSGSTAGTGNAKTWTFRWQAATGLMGPVTFYAAGNAANGNGSFAGDLVYTASLQLPQGTTQRGLATSTNVLRVRTDDEKTYAVFDFATAAKGTLTLADASGRTWWTRNIEISPGTTVLPFDAPKGVYCLTFATAHGTLVRKFVR
ncbi:MAG: choice-of-anchor V domain-containing protein, partial [Bacteroidia bacterium]|nr:hypothetical protein [Bacteroidia bacterium]MDW8333997.1 choice-of-anchor V domain-containing protein [Bacteroidia bacterium]